MSRPDPDGSVWGRPEAIDSLSRRPGRGRRWAIAGLGAVSLACGAWLGTSTVTAAMSPVAQIASAPGANLTCSSVGVTLIAGAYPAEGVPERGVVRLYRADPDGHAEMILPQAHVLRSTPGPDGTLTLSVAIRSGPPGNDRQAVDVAGASAAKSLTATVLYDVDPVRVLDVCREG